MSRLKMLADRQARRQALERQAVKAKEAREARRLGKLQPSRLSR
jgi:hypothetical protein